jgi:outer membrane lipoprotein-sorting protein
MKHENENEWLDPMLDEPEQFDFEKWAENHPEEARLLRCGFEKSGRSARTKPFEIWRFIMESKVTRYSAAAVIVLAMALVLLSPFGPSGNSGVVLADVQQKVAGIETMIIRGTKTFTHPGEDGDVFEFDGFKGEFDLVKYLSKQYGLVEEGYVEDKLIYRITFNHPKRQTLVVLPPWKKYVTSASTDKQMYLLENLTPKGIVNLLMAGDYKELGRDSINGVEVEVFEFQDPVTFKELAPKAFFDVQNIKGKVWIGIKEQMPVRVEGDFVIGKCLMSMFHDLNLHEVNTMGEYNVELDEEIFDTNPPEGYTELTLSDILPLIPVEAKAGLVGLGILPAGFIFWKKRRRKRATTDPN